MGHVKRTTLGKQLSSLSQGKVLKDALKSFENRCSDCENLCKGLKAILISNL